MNTSANTSTRTSNTDTQVGGETVPDEPTFRSGVAARLTGIPVETLRVWERRYSVVGPKVSARGQRLYTSIEIRRLSLIKQLVDMGHAIGDIAPRSTDELLSMRSEAGTLTLNQQPDNSAGVARNHVVLIGPMLSTPQFAQRMQDSGMTVAARHANIPPASEQQALETDAILIMELPTLGETSLEMVDLAKQRCGAQQAIVLYRFAASAIIRQLRKAGHEVARAPSDATELEALCRALHRPLARPAKSTPDLAATRKKSATNAGIPPPRFDQKSLSTLAQSSVALYCECPHHLVELVLSLGSFERYSAECANRDARDAKLHRDLQHTAAHARAMLEDALLMVALAEGLPVPAQAP